MDWSCCFWIERFVVERFVVGCRRVSDEYTVAWPMARVGTSWGVSIYASLTQLGNYPRHCYAKINSPHSKEKKGLLLDGRVYCRPCRDFVGWGGFFVGRVGLCMVFVGWVVMFDGQRSASGFCLVLLLNVSGFCWTGGLLSGGACHFRSQVVVRHVGLLSDVLDFCWMLLVGKICMSRYSLSYKLLDKHIVFFFTIIQPFSHPFCKYFWQFLDDQSLV